MLISPDVDLTLFFTFITSCKTSSIKIWFVSAAGLAENLTQQVVFHQPFVIQHVRTRSCETWNFLFFIFFYHHITIWVTKMHDQTIPYQQASNI